MSTTDERVFREVIYRVVDKNGNFLQVHPGEHPGTLELCTLPQLRSADWFGKVNLIIPPDFAEELGRSLIDMADLIRQEKT